MKAIILAAGIGSRLQPITDNKPKCMVEVHGVSILEWQIKAYLKAGISMDEIFVVTGYLSDFIKDFLEQKYPAVNIVQNDDYLTTNNMFSLNMALNQLDVNTDNVFISNGDCVYDLDIVYELYNDCRKDLIAVDIGLFNDENMKIVYNGVKVIDIAKTITEDSSYGCSIDIYKLSNDSLRKLKRIVDDFLKSDINSWTEMALKILFDETIFEPFDIKGKSWIEIDNIDDLLVGDRKFCGFNLQAKKAMVLDLDGTVYLGDKPIQNAIDFINRNINNYTFFFMTNNTSKSKQVYVDKLKEMGISVVSIKNVITPLDSLMSYLKKESIKNIYCLGTNAFKEEIMQSGINVSQFSNTNELDAIVLSYDTEIDYKKISEFGLLLNSQVKYLATHSDVVCPTEDGFIPDIGSFIEMFNASNDRRPEKIFGKPNKDLLQPILNEFKRDEIVVVGDRLYTDKILAENSGIDFALVLSGETMRYQVDGLDRFPSVILNDLGDLSE